MIKKASIALAAAVLIAGTASAQATGGAVRSSTSKLFLGAALNGSSIKFEGDGSETRTGGGISLQLGYGFTPKFALFVEAAGGPIEPEEGDDGSYTLGHFDIGARYHFSNPSRKLAPYLEAALTGRSLMATDVDFDGDPGTAPSEVTFSGAGFSFGGGLLYFFNPKWAFNGGLKWTTGEFSTIKVDNVSVTGFEADATSARVNLGITWFPKGG
jgi:hypothetical protein